MENKPIRCYGCKSREIGECNCDSIYPARKYLEGKRILDFIAHYRICESIFYWIGDYSNVTHNDITDELLEDIYYDIWLNLELYDKENKSLEEKIFKNSEKIDREISLTVKMNIEIISINKQNQS